LNLSEALEQSFQELGIDLDGDSDFFQSETNKKAEEPEALEGAEGDEPVDSPSDTEDTEDEADEENKADVNAQVLEVPEGAILRLPDGTEVDADKAVLFQSDYTKKTQQLAEERKTLDGEKEQFEAERGKIADAYEQMRGWYESRASNPTEWVKEIISETQDPTATIAKALYELANDGRLDPEFVKAFGIDAGEVAQKATQSKKDSEIADLRKKVEERERSEIEQKAIKEQAQKYQSEWDAIKADHSLNFETRDAEIQAKRELLNFALNSRMSHSLKDAYDLMLVRTGRLSQPKVESVPKPDPQVTEKKRASRAVTPRSSASGAGVSKVGKPRTTRDAALQAIEEYARNA
jgi:hypothetical protein